MDSAQAATEIASIAATSALSRRDLVAAIAMHGYIKSRPLATATERARQAQIDADALLVRLDHVESRALENRDPKLATPISGIGLQIRPLRTAENLGCATVADILELSEDDFMCAPNFGATSLQDLRHRLGELGLTLRTSRPR